MVKCARMMHAASAKLSNSVYNDKSTAAMESHLGDYSRSRAFVILRILARQTNTCDPCQNEQAADDLQSRQRLPEEVVRPED